MMQTIAKNKELALTRLLTQYDDTDMWIHNYLPTENITDDEKQHLKDVMVRDQALKKLDADRIVKMTATFPAKLRPELLSPVVDEMRQNNPAVPGSGLVSLCGTVALPKDPNNQIPPSTPQFLRSQSMNVPYEMFGSTATTAATTPSPDKRFSFVELSTSPLSATFQKFSDRGSAPERCPLCHRKFSMFQKTRQCEQCQRTACANCSNEFVTNGVVYLCDECLEITRVLCKTGDWFAQYLVLKPANPLRLEVDLSPTQNNSPSRRGSRQIMDDAVIRQHNAVPVLAQPPPTSRSRLAAAQQMQQAQQTALHRQNAVNGTTTTEPTANGVNPSATADRFTWTHTSRLDMPDDPLRKSAKKRPTLQKTMSTPDGSAPVENTLGGSDQVTKTSPSRRGSRQVTMQEPLEQVNEADEAAQLDRSRKLKKSKLRRYSLSLARANSYTTKNDLEATYQTRVEIKGELEVSLDYEPIQSRLAIMVWMARNIAAVDRKAGTSNPYAKVFLYPDPANKTQRKLYCKGHTCSPAFNQGVCYSVSPSDMHEKVVIVELWHKKSMGSKTFLGEVKIPLRNHKWDDKERKRLMLEQKLMLEHNPIPVEVKPTYRGELSIGLRFSMSQNHRLISQLNIGSTNFPGLLEVAVHQAKHLISESAGANVSAFVKAILRGERVHFEPQTTDVIRKSCHPVWNSVMRFNDLTQNDLLNVELEISVWHRPMMTKAAQLLGGVRLGNYCGPNANHHMPSEPHREEMHLWNELLQKPNIWVEGILPLRDISY